MKYGNADANVTFMHVFKVGEPQTKVLTLRHKGLKGISRQEAQIAMMQTLIEEHAACRIGAYHIKFFPVDKSEREIAEWLGFEPVSRKAIHGMSLHVDNGWVTAARELVAAVQCRMR